MIVFLKILNKLGLKVQLITTTSFEKEYMLNRFAVLLVFYSKPHSGVQYCNMLSVTR